MLNDSIWYSILLFQRTFVGVDFFSVFQEVYLQTNDPRVTNIVSFSDAIGELKVEVILSNFNWSYHKFNTHFCVKFYFIFFFFNTARDRLKLVNFLV